jgi:hypothetical protein
MVITSIGDVSPRQVRMKRFVLYPLSYGPPDVGPAGIEPATTSTQSCSSICIRSATSKLLFQLFLTVCGGRDGSRTRINAATRDLIPWPSRRLETRASDDPSSEPAPASSTVLANRLDLLHLVLPRLPAISTFLAVALPSVPARPLSLLVGRCLAATSFDETFFVLYH